MKNTTTFVLNQIIATFLILVIFIGCKKESENNDFSNHLRVLKVTSDGNDLSSGDPVEKEDLSIQLIFSHSLDPSGFESALSINVSDYSISYDQNNSFVTIVFPDDLDFETSYTVFLPQGNYGANGEEILSDFTFSFVTPAFIPPTVSLSAEKLNLLEGETTTITASLNEPTIGDVVIDLKTSGNAIVNSDYTLESISLTIPEGEITIATTLEILNDPETEGEESLSISIENVSIAVEAEEQILNFTINDEIPALILKGIMAIRWSSETDGNSGKAIHLKTTKDIADLSIYGLGIANNGGGTDGVEYSFPAISVLAGEDIVISREPTALEAYFVSACFSEFEHVIQSDEMTQNGDDAIELFKESTVIETYGNADVDGTDQDWDYTETWAYKLGSEWITGVSNCSLASTTTLDSECIYPLCDNPLVLKGIMALLWDGSGTNGGKAIHLLANRDIDDLSIYGLGVANNGGGTDGEEYSLPAVMVAEGDHILIAREVNTLTQYFGSCADGYAHVFETDAMNQNGDDAIELFQSGVVIETYGDVDVDGTDEFWDYAGRWAFKVASSWTYSDADCSTTSTTTQNSLCPYPYCE